MFFIVLGFSAMEDREISLRCNAANLLCCGDRVAWISSGKLSLGEKMISVFVFFPSDFLVLTAPCR